MRERSVTRTGRSLSTCAQVMRELVGSQQGVDLMRKAVVISGTVWVSSAFLGAVALLAVGCSLHRPVPRADGAAGSADTGAGSVASEIQAASDNAGVPAAKRVAGDTQAVAEFLEGEFRSGPCRIPTPLPEGYPPPSPPGAIELKCYPLVRRAGISGSMSPDWGMNFAFFPLFNHIKRRDIAMTSPVEMNYDGLGEPGATKPRGWTMSFLYRTPELGPRGTDSHDERVLVEDIPPITVVAIGLRGPYRLDRVKTGLAALREWLASQTEWEECGAPRALFYNGPEVRSGNKWLEVQLPVRRR